MSSGEISKTEDEKRLVKEASTKTPPAITSVCRNMQSDVVELLKQVLQWTPLYRPGLNSALLQASKVGSLGCVKILLSSGAEIESEDDNGDTPFVHAFRGGHLTVMHHLHSYGCNTEIAKVGVALSKLDASFVKECVGMGVLVENEDWDVCREEEITILLRDLCLDPFEGQYGRHSFEDSPFMWAVQEGRAEVVQWMVTKHPCPNKYTEEERRGFMAEALFRTIRNKRRQIVKLLLEHLGADMECRDEQGRTPLLMACGHDEDTAKYLLGKGADGGVVDGEGLSALHWAACSGQKEVCGLLLERGVWVDVAANLGATPLMVACSSRKVEVVELLLTFHTLPESFSTTPPQTTPPHTTTHTTPLHTTPPHTTTHTTPLHTTPPHTTTPHTTPPKTTPQTTPPHTTPPKTTPHTTPPHTTSPQTIPPQTTPPHTTSPHIQQQPSQQPLPLPSPIQLKPPPQTSPSQQPPQKLPQPRPPPNSAFPSANPNACTIEGWTALHVAVRACAPSSILHSLIRNGATPNTTSTTLTHNNDPVPASTPLLLAIALNSLRMVHVLLNARADVDMRGMVSRGASKEAGGVDGRGGMVTRGANERRRNEGRDSREEDERRNEEFGNVGLSSSSPQPASPHNRHTTPLQFAIHSKAFEVAVVLLRLGCKIDSPSFEACRMVSSTDPSTTTSLHSLTPLPQDKLEHLRQVIWQSSSQPPSLKHMCRLIIRKNMAGNDLAILLPLLPRLPPSLTHFLLLKDLFENTIHSFDV